MHLDRDTVDRIAHLARLQLAEAEAEGYARHLSDILDFVAQLDDADTAGTEPLAHPLEVTQRLLGSGAEIDVAHASLVGEYALGLTFSPDGHATGIFPFELLRTLSVEAPTG